MGFLSNPGSLSPGPFSHDAARLPLLPPALSSGRAATGVAPSRRAVRASASHVRRRPPSTAPPDPCCCRHRAIRVMMTGAGAAPPLPTERDAEHHQRSITPFVLCENTQSLTWVCLFLFGSELQWPGSWRLRLVNGDARSVRRHGREARSMVYQFSDSARDGAGGRCRSRCRVCPVHSLSRVLFVWIFSSSYFWWASLSAAQLSFNLQVYFWSSMRTCVQS